MHKEQVDKELAEAYKRIAELEAKKKDLDEGKIKTYFCISNDERAIKFRDENGKILEHLTLTYYD